MPPPLSQPRPASPAPYRQPRHQDADQPPVAQPARQTVLHDLMWVVFGVDCFAAGVLGYLSIILLLAVGDVRASVSCLLLGILLFVAGAIPRWFPQWLTRAGIPNPLALNPR